MIINVYNDYSLDEFLGGAELTISQLVKLGKQKGLEFKIYNRNNDLPAGFWLVGNCDLLKIEKLNFLSSQNHITITNNSIINNNVLQIYMNSLANIFLAPNHGLQIQNNRLLYAPFIDYKKFKPLNTFREGFAYFGRLTPDKGLQETAEAYNYPVKLKVFGYPEFVHNKVEYMGEYTQANVNSLMNEYETFFWRLNRYGCYGRTIVEAILSGMEIDVNKENFGLFTYGEVENRRFLIDLLEYHKATIWLRILDKISQYVD